LFVLLDCRIYANANTTTIINNTNSTGLPP
jgi:hypothetical protein